MQQELKEREGISEKRPKSMMLYGCLTIIILFFVIGFASYFGLRSVAAKFVEKIAENSALSLPAASLPKEELDVLLHRLHEFRDSLLADQETNPLFLSAREINGLIAHNPKWNDIKESFYITIDNNIISCQFSFPLEDLGFSGKYFNGSARLQLRLKQDVLVVAFDSLTLKGEEVPERYMRLLRQNNFADDLNDDPQMIKVIQHLNSITVKDGSIIVTGLHSKGS